MTSIFLWLEAHSFVHVGASAAGDVIDLPVAREAATGWPYIPGSGLKGALRDAFRDRQRLDDRDDKVTQVFGDTDKAGAVLVSDARLAFFPLASLQAAYVLATCPALLRRLRRDLLFVDSGRTDLEDLVPASEPKPGEALWPAGLDGANSGGKLFVEEFSFGKAGNGWSAFQYALEAALKGHEHGPEIVKRTVVLNDADFRFFARRRVPVRMRNQLEPGKKTVSGTGLWSEESLAPETLLYAILSPRRPGQGPQIQAVTGLLGDANGYFQVGGNETVGEGWLYTHGVKPTRKTSSEENAAAATDAAPAGDGGRT